MFRGLTGSVSLLLVLVACTTSTGDTTSTAVTTSPVVTASTEGTTATPATNTPIQTSIGSGRLVVLDGSGDVVVMDPDGSNRVAITDNAGDIAIYSQPIWSPDGAFLAWGQATADGFAVGIQGVEEILPTTVDTSNLPFYMYWSPNSQHIGVLRNGAVGLDFVMVDVPDASTSVVAGGSPFYFSWSPGSEHVVTHVGADRFETVGPDGAREQLGPTAPGYLVPQWTSAGIFHVVDDGLVVEVVGGERRQLVELGEFTWFVVNRQGTHVALQSTGGDPGISVGLTEVAAIPGDVVVVLEVATGESEVLTQRPALGFFWSPDGESLRRMTPTDEGIQKSVWGLRGDTTDYGVFRPSISLIREIVPFFPQYAQSVSFWAPDSMAFAYSADDGIWVQGIGGGAPNKVSDGSWVAWSVER